MIVGDLGNRKGITIVVFLPGMQRKKGTSRPKKNIVFQSISSDSEDELADPNIILNTKEMQNKVVHRPADRCHLSFSDHITKACLEPLMEQVAYETRCSFLTCTCTKLIVQSQKSKG